MSIPVLMYHHILPKEGFIASNIENFKKQMNFLKESGFYTLSAEEFYKYKKGEFKAPKKSVFLTFDDGWRDNIIYAYPILKELDLKATVFLVTQWIDKASEKKEEFKPLNHKECKKTVPTNPNRVIMSWSDIESSQDVFDFHSHTATHRDFYFEKLSWQEDLYNSRETLKKRLGFEDKHLCWPRGFYDDELIKLAIQTGYKVLYTTKRGVNLPDNNLLGIKRVAVKKDDKWLKKNLMIFSNNFLGDIYAKIKPE